MRKFVRIKTNMQINERVKKKEKSSLFTYFLLVSIRIVLVFLPQYGYIHPDEFFQSSEIVAGENRIFLFNSQQIS